MTMTLHEALAEVKLAKQSGAMDGTTAKAWEIIEEAVASGALVPASDVQLATALVVQKAAGVIEDNELLHGSGADELRPRSEGNRSGLAYATAILTLAPTDALAELNALRAERDALREARIAFQNVDCQVEDAGEFTERAWEQLRAALQPTTQAQEGEG